MKKSSSHQRNDNLFAVQPNPKRYHELERIKELEDLNIVFRLPGKEVRFLRC